jgi:hypothetical protein
MMTLGLTLGVLATVGLFAWAVNAWRDRKLSHPTSTTRHLLSRTQSPSRASPRSLLSAQDEELGMESALPYLSQISAMGSSDTRY